MTTREKTQLIGRRAELMAELVLQDLLPEFVVQATAPDFAYDFLVGFANERGGINSCAVEVKSTEKPVSGTFRLKRHAFDRLAHSNIPVLLLVVDVKRNAIYYAWPADNQDAIDGADYVSIPVRVLDEKAMAALRERMLR